ncbi:F-box associated domain containing protein [Tanacetum coccineum]
MAFKDKQKSKRINESIPKLLKEIIIQILLKLPLESLSRCKSVCKEWLSLISEQSFIKSHLALSKNKHFLFKKSDGVHTCLINGLLSDNPITKLLGTRIPLIADDYARVVGSCNGLLCIGHYQVVGVSKADNKVKIYSLNTENKNNLVSFYLENETYDEVLHRVYDEGNKTLDLRVLGEWLNHGLDSGKLCDVK